MPTSLASDSQTPLQKACGRLKSAGLRITQPRIAILAALIKRDVPVTIEQLHDELSSSACDLVTVYRCLAAFEELGLVRRCYFQNGTSLYQIQLGTEAIYHVVSKDTDAVQTLDESLSAELRVVIGKIEDDLKAKGFSGITHMVEFFANAPAGRR